MMFQARSDKRARRDSSSCQQESRKKKQKSSWGSCGEKKAGVV